MHRMWDNLKTDKELHQILLYFGTGFGVGGGLSIMVNEMAVGIVLFGVGIIAFLIELWIHKRNIEFETFPQAVQMSNAIWGYWHTFIDKFDNEVIAKPKLKRILLPLPDRRHLKDITDISGLQSTKTSSDFIKQIEKLAPEKVRYYGTPLTYTFTIYDKTPIEENGELLPRSNEAWIVVQILEPNTPPNDRHKYVIKKKKDENKFQKFYSYYDGLWRANEQTKESPKG